MTVQNVETVTGVVDTKEGRTLSVYSVSVMVYEKGAFEMSASVRDWPTHGSINSQVKVVVLLV